MPNATPGVSLICLCYNTGEHITDTLNSIKSQSFKDFELIVCDDGSIDDSTAIISSWIEQNQNELTFPVEFIQNDINLGIPKTLNKALRVSRAPYYSLIGDDEWYPDYLESLYKLIVQTDRSISLVFADTDVVDYATQTLLQEINPLKNIRQHYPQPDQLITPVAPDVYRFNKGYIYECFFLFSPVIAFTTLIKTDIVKSLGGYNEEYNFEDLPMWLQMFQQYDCIFLDRKLAKYNKRSQSVSMTMSFSYQESIVKILLHQLDAKRIIPENSYFKTRVLNEFNALVQAWKKDKVRNIRGLFALTMHIRRYYPLSVPSFFKLVLKTLFQKS